MSVAVKRDALRVARTVTMKLAIESASIKIRAMSRSVRATIRSETEMSHGTSYDLENSARWTLETCLLHPVHKRPVQPRRDQLQWRAALAVGDFDCPPQQRCGHRGVLPRR